MVSSSGSTYATILEVASNLLIKDSSKIIIAHRISAVRRADEIIYLENGKIAEEGTYDELIAKGGSFAALVKKQLEQDHKEMQ